MDAVASPTAGAAIIVFGPTKIFSSKLNRSIMAQLIFDPYERNFVIISFISPSIKDQNWLTWHLKSKAYGARISYGRYVRRLRSSEALF